MRKYHVIGPAELCGREEPVVARVRRPEYFGQVVCARVTVRALRALVDVQYLGHAQELHQVELAVGVDVQPPV